MGSFILREKPGKKIVENLYKWWSCKFKKSGLNELNKPPMLISIPGLASHPSFQKWHRSHVFVGWWTSKPLKTLGEKTKKKTCAIHHQSTSTYWPYLGEQLASLTIEGSMYGIYPVDLIGWLKDVFVVRWLSCFCCCKKLRFAPGTGKIPASDLLVRWECCHKLPTWSSNNFKWMFS